MNIKEIESESVEWTHLAQDRVQYLDVVKTAMNFRIQ
jgi:hypothetical protein